MLQNALPELGAELDCSVLLHKLDNMFDVCTRAEATQLLEQTLALPQQQRQRAFESIGRALSQYDGGKDGTRKFDVHRCSYSAREGPRADAALAWANALGVVRAAPQDLVKRAAVLAVKVRLNLCALLLLCARRLADVTVHSMQDEGCTTLNAQTNVAPMNDPVDSKCA